MAEIEVLGGGIFGLSVAYECLRRGAKVRLIEAQEIGAGASGGIVGALAPHTPDNWNDKKQFQYESLTRMQAYWAGVDALSGGNSGYRRTGRLIAIPDQRQLDLARGRVTSAQHFWHGFADWSVHRDTDFDGLAPRSETGFVSFDTLSARISPRTACNSLAGAIRALGGEIILGESRPRGGGAVVLCTGYQGLVEMSATLGTELGKGIKGQAILVEHNARSRPQVFADGVHFIPHENGTLAIGSTTEIDWDNGDTTDDQLDDLYNRALNICPVLHGAQVLARWAGVRPRGRRRAPILGRYPGHENLYVANGGFKIGFGVAIRAGEVMADLVLNGTADIPEGFSVTANLS